MKFIYKGILYVILFLPIIYSLVWIHELGHVLGAILSGNKSPKVVVNIFADSIAYMIYYNPSGKWFIFIMGSISTLIIAFPFLIYALKKKNTWVLSIVFIAISKETLYWGISPFTNYGDAYLLIEWAIYYKLNVLVIIIRILSIMFLIITICVLILMFYFSSKWLTLKLKKKYSFYK